MSESTNRPFSGNEDVEGHKVLKADAETAEDQQDVEGHRVLKNQADAETAEGDDVEGHAVRPGRG